MKHTPPCKHCRYDDDSEINLAAIAAFAMARQQLDASEGTRTSRRSQRLDRRATITTTAA